MKQGSDINYDELLLAIKKDGMSAMLPLYSLHREKYLSFTSRYTKDRDLRLHSFHDAVVQTYRAVISNAYDASKSNLKTYLFNVGKNKLINGLEKENTRLKYRDSNEFIHTQVKSDDVGVGNAEHANPRIEQLSTSFDLLGEKCKELILYFYYDQLDIEEIMVLMKYNSVSVVYSAKSRCLKKLREYISTSSERN